MIESYSNQIAPGQAKLTLTAISKRHGSIIQDNLLWTMIEKKTQKKYFSEKAQPIFELPIGEYQLSVTHQNQKISADDLSLRPQMNHDHVILLEIWGTEREMEEGEIYIVDPEEVTKVTEYERRELERQGQREYGVAAGPLASPYIEQGQGLPFARHPLISMAAQFDGVGPTLNPDPNENQEALAKRLELDHQLTAQPSPTISPPTPSPQ